MTTLLAHRNKVRAGAVKPVEASRILAALEELCLRIGPRGRVPRHTDLMRQLDASERMVLKCLEELQRQGRVIRVQGSGTFVTDTAKTVQGVIRPVGSFNSLRTITAIARPDRSIFDRCMELLYDSAGSHDLSVTCHLLGAESLDRVEIEDLGSPLGFIIFHRSLAPLAKELQATGHRVVLVGAPNVQEVLGVPCVCSNHSYGGYLVTKHLLQLGHVRIAYSDISNGLHSSLRWQGHEKAMREASKAGALVQHEVIDDEMLRAWTVNPGMAKAYFKSAKAPTAIAAWNDRNAIDLISVLTRAGLNVPNDVSIIGYDNLTESNRVSPSLTTVDHLIDQQVAAAIDVIRQEVIVDTNRTLVFAPTIIHRDSTARIDGNQWVV